MEWLDRAEAVLEGYLGGQAWGGAVADILFGDANPSGKLAETFPVCLEDTPCYLSFPGDEKTVRYPEGIFTGYRYYDSRNLNPLFPFGHGLSYTSFEYSDLSLSRTEMTEDQECTVTVKITNTGKRAGMETVQFYVRDEEASVIRPVHELKGFDKIRLEPGETGTVSAVLNRRSFAFWDITSGDWKAEPGRFTVEAGSSSRDIRLTAGLTLLPLHREKTIYDHNDVLGDILDHPEAGETAESIRKAMTARFGRYDETSAEFRMMDSVVREMPLRNIVRMSQENVLSEKDLILLLDVLNGKTEPGKLKNIP
jgi:beta-glucosidase